MQPEMQALKPITPRRAAGRRSARKSACRPGAPVTQTMIDHVRRRDGRPPVHPLRSGTRRRRDAVRRHHRAWLPVAVAALGLAFETMPPLEGANMGINHGFDTVRFLGAGQDRRRIRARFVLADVKVRPSGWIQIANDVTIEIEGSKKPALTARWLTLTFVEPQAGDRMSDPDALDRGARLRPTSSRACAGFCRASGHREIQLRPVEPDLSPDRRQRPLSCCAPSRPASC